MEITAPQNPTLTPAPFADNDSTGKAGLGAPTLSADTQDVALPRHQTQLMHAASQLASVQETRQKAHAEAVQAFSAAFGRAGKQATSDAPFVPVSLGELDSLQDALAGAALSEKLDQPRAESAKRQIQNLSFDDDNARKTRSAQHEPVSESSSRSGVDGGKISDIWKHLAECIAKAQDGDLKEFSEALARYTALYQLLTNILSALETLIKPDGDNYMQVDFNKLGELLQGLLDKYKDPVSPELIIAGKSPNGGLSKAEAEAVCKKLGLDPAKCAKANASGDGSYYVIPDLSQIENMKENLPKDNRISIAAYNAWKAGFDSQMSRFEDALQARGQKYSNVYSRFENFNKTISSILQTMADMLRQYLQF